MKTAQKAPVPTPAGKRPPRGLVSSANSRPRRFSLIYSSDESSLSDANEVAATDAELIRQLRGSGLTYAAIDDSEGDDDDDVDDDDDDDDSYSEDDSDSDYTSSSSDDETVDFVRLSAQRKKRAMEVLSAIRRGEQPPVLLNGSMNRKKNKKWDKVNTESGGDSLNDSGSDSNGVYGGFTGNRRPKYTKTEIEAEDHTEAKGEEEDIGEEVPNTRNTSESKNIDEVDRMYVPNVGESDDGDEDNDDDDRDSEYDIDQDAYFDVIKEDIDETGEIDDDAPILEEEEQNIVSELHDGDALSSDDESVHESSSDSVEDDSREYDDEWNYAIGYDDGNNGTGIVTTNDDEEDDDDNDAITSDFDAAFYEDPKFSNLYYYQGNKELKLSSNNKDLPKIPNEEKKRLLEQKLARRKERKERLQARKLLKRRARMNRYHYDGGGSTMTSKRPGTRNLGSRIDHLDGAITNNDWYNRNYDHDNGTNGFKYLAFDDSEYSFREFFYDDNFHRDLDDYTPLSDVTSDSEYDNIFLNVSEKPPNGNGKLDHPKREAIKQDPEEGLDLEDMGESIDIDAVSELSSDDDSSSISNIFIDIDDLDPDSPYFKYSDDDTSSVYNISDDSKLSEATDSAKEEETVAYVDDDSTDEDDNIPPPNERDQSIGTCAREVLDSNATDLRPPKLGTWKTDNKPFSIIDGLSTKSLYVLIQEHQQLREQRQKALNGTIPTTDTDNNNNNNNSLNTTDMQPNNGASTGDVKNENEISLNELLNISDLEEDPHDSRSYQHLWSKEPVTLLPTFPNEDVDNLQGYDDYLVPDSHMGKVSVGYLGNDHARRKIDKMKQIRRKRIERKRQLKKRRKLLKLKRERARAEKVGSLMPPLETPVEEPLPLTQEILEGEQPKVEDEPDLSAGIESPNGQESRKNSVKSLGLEEINKLLLQENKDISNNEIAIIFGDDDGNDDFKDGNLDDSNVGIINEADSSILASLTAPLDFDDFSKTTTSHWKQRRQSLVEATAENLRYTKNGLFSEAAMADLESIFNGSNISGGYDSNDILQ